MRVVEKLEVGWYGGWGGSLANTPGLATSPLVATKATTRVGLWTSGPGSVWVPSSPSRAKPDPLTVGSVRPLQIFSRHKLWSTRVNTQTVPSHFKTKQNNPPPAKKNTLCQKCIVTMTCLLITSLGFSLRNRGDPTPRWFLLQILGD